MSRSPLPHVVGQAKAGADLSVKDCYGETAAQSYTPKLKAALAEAGANP